jgi:HEAT repeat protein
MKRFVCLVLACASLVGALPAMARGGRAEAQGLVDQLVTGGIGLNQAVNRLEFLGEAGWAAAELTLLLRKAPDTRRQAQLLTAIAALAQPGDEDVEKALLKGLAWDDVGLRVAVIRGLGRMKSERAVAPLTALLKDPLLGVRREAARSLGLLGAQKAGAALAAAAKAEEDVEARAAMLLAVGRAQDKKQAAALEPFLKDGSESTRLAAAQGLCLLGDKRGFDFARALLAGKTRDERLQGVLVLEGLAAKVTTPMLQPVLADADHRVRATAARVLAQGGDATKVGWLVVESAKATADDRLAYEDQLEKLHLTDEDRSAWLKKAGLK